MRASCGRQQGRHHLLHLHEARALDDDGQRRRRHRQRRDQRLHVVEMACAVECRARVGAERAGRPQLVDAALLRIGPDLAVERRAVRADLAHVAEHQPARPGQAGQHVDCRAHRVGIGVVGVVDEGHVAALALHAPHLRAALHGREALETASDRLQRTAGGQRTRRGGQRVLHVVQAGRLQAGGDRPRRRVNHQRPAVGGPRRLGHDVGLPLQREGERGSRAGHLLPQRRERVVGREHRDTERPQRLDHRAVLARYRLHARHELLVLALRVVDQADGGRGDGGELGDLADMVHAELDDAGEVPGLVVLAQAQQRQRHADVVVQVAFGREGRIGLPGAQDRRDHLRDRGLAVAAGHRDQRKVAAPSPSRRQLAEGAPRVGHLQAGQAGFGQPVFGHACNRAGLFRLREEIVRVEPLALQRDEEVARPQAARVAVHAADLHRAVADERRRRQQRMRLRQAHHGRILRTPVLWASIVRASTMSEKGCFTPATS